MEGKEEGGRESAISDCAGEGKRGRRKASFALYTPGSLFPARASQSKRGFFLIFFLTPSLKRLRFSSYFLRHDPSNSSSLLSIFVVCTLVEATKATPSLAMSK